MCAHIARNALGQTLAECARPSTTYTAAASPFPLERGANSKQTPPHASAPLSVDHRARLPQRLDVILVDLAVLDEQHVQRILDLGRHPPVEVLVRPVAVGRLRHPAQRHRDLPHVRVHREVGALEAEHEHTRDGLGADALEAAQLGLDGVVVERARVLHRELAALVAQRLQDALDPRRLRRRQPARPDRLLDVGGRRGQHGLPRREGRLEAAEGAVRVDISRVLRQDRADERVEHQAPIAAAALPRLSARLLLLDHLGMQPAQRRVDHPALSLSRVLVRRVRVALERHLALQRSERGRLGRHGRLGRRRLQLAHLRHLHRGQAALDVAVIVARCRRPS
mmetsp:Transcript_16451/g.49322  ORF Transcript_16451/g.49322 Transcript_16451/m.49322 type:complete len:338 (+) Transcript_16451:235-1248(+)